MIRNRAPLPWAVQAENICWSILQQLVTDKFPSITIDSETAWNYSEDSADFLNDSIDSKRDSQTTVDFKRKLSRSNLALTAEALQRAHRMLLTVSENNKINIRSIYYDLQPHHRDLTMDKINHAINNVKKLLGCSRWDLGIVATSKGLVAGDLTLNFPTKSIAYNTSHGDLIPQEMFELTSIRTTAEFLLVVEKDTIFQKLLGQDESCPARLNCIMITGKGEPDFATRILVNRLAEIENLPTYILVDNDPYGFEIMCTYRFGSKDYRQWASPSARWIGIHPEELGSMRINPIPLKEEETKKLQSLKERSDLKLKKQLRRQLRKMKKIGKVEIETVANLTDAFLSDFYIPDKIFLKEFY